jgi:hypothetical protein
LALSRQLVQQHKNEPAGQHAVFIRHREELTERPGQRIRGAKIEQELQDGIELVPHWNILQ